MSPLGTLFYMFLPSRGECPPRRPDTFPFPESLGQERVTGKLGEAIVYLPCDGPLGLDALATRDSHQCEYAGGNGRACSQQMALTVSRRGLEAAISNRNFEFKRALRRAQFFCWYNHIGFLLSVTMINSEWVNDHVMAPLREIIALF